jgi:4-hydroxyphenylpyruvate dioxygenase
MTHFDDKPASVYGMDSFVMKIDHIHFYVEDVSVRRDWFVQTMGCQVVRRTANPHTATEVLKHGAVYFVLSSPLSAASPVADYLKKHPPGVADIALRVNSIEQLLAKADQIQVPLQRSQLGNGLRWARINGWGSLSHTLIENYSGVDVCPTFFDPEAQAQFNTQINTQIEAETTTGFTSIDHIVLNVPMGALGQAVAWYQALFGFEVQQAFQIETQTSGLNSKVLKSLEGDIYFNINEPSSAQSQIQTFLDDNQGSGIQHIALKTPNIVQAVTQMQERGMSFLSVPAAYYTQLKQRLQQVQRSPSVLQGMQTIAAQHILMDWKDSAPESILLQIFSQPIFEQRTFFLS